MTNVKFFGLFLLAITISTSAQTNLSGNIGGMILEKNGNPFIVGENITIPVGKKVTILEGCVFLFKPFTGVTVEGSLSVAGTAEAPVIFTSFNDSAHNTATTQPPDAFDWNGITISPRARHVDFAHIILEYSVYGIKSQTYDIRITQGTFTGNGQFNLTVNDEIQAITDNIPFNFNGEGDSLSATAAKRTPLRWKWPLGIGTGIVGIGGMGATGYFVYKLNTIDRQYDNTDNNSLISGIVANYNKNRTYAIMAGCTGGVFLIAGAGLLLADHFEFGKRSAMVYPLLGREAGIVMVMEF